MIPAAVGGGTAVLTGAAAASNPLTMLAAPLAGLGGLPGFSDSGSAYSNAVQDQLFNTPFNVGSGSLTSSPDKTGGAGTGAGIERFLPAIFMGVVAWVAVSLLK